MGTHSPTRSMPLLAVSSLVLLLGTIYLGVTFEHVLTVFEQDTLVFTFYLSIALLIADVSVVLYYLMRDYLGK